MLLGQLTGALDHPADAIRIYQKILSKRPDLDLVQYRLAALTGSQDDESAAARVVEPLRSDRPSDPLLVDSLGWAQYRAGQTKRARESLLAAVNGAPDEPLPQGASRTSALCSASLGEVDGSEVPRGDKVLEAKQSGSGDPASELMAIVRALTCDEAIHVDGNTLVVRKDPATATLDCNTLRRAGNCDHPSERPATRSASPPARR